MKRQKLRSKRERTAEEVGKMLREDATFRKNFLNVLPVSPSLRMLLDIAIEMDSSTDSRTSPDSEKAEKDQN